jgi:hypothetical protein
VRTFAVSFPLSFSADKDIYLSDCMARRSRNQIKYNSGIQEFLPARQFVRWGLLGENP